MPAKRKQSAAVAAASNKKQKDEKKVVDTPVIKHSDLEPFAGPVKVGCRVYYQRMRSDPNSIALAIVLGKSVMSGDWHIKFQNGGSCTALTHQLFQPKDGFNPVIAAAASVSPPDESEKDEKKAVTGAAVARESPVSAAAASVVPKFVRPAEPEFTEEEKKTLHRFLDYVKAEHAWMKENGVKNSGGVTGVIPWVGVCDHIREFVPGHHGDDS